MDRQNGMSFSHNGKIKDGKRFPRRPTGLKADREWPYAAEIDILRSLHMTRCVRAGFRSG